MQTWRQSARKWLICGGIGAVLACNGGCTGTNTVSLDGAVGGEHDSSFVTRDAATEPSERDDAGPIRDDAGPVEAGLSQPDTGDASASEDNGPCAGRVLQVEFSPTARVQLALWLETDDLSMFRTLRLSEATARHGIGNRPGAMQMNSGYRWPYGRRESVLPHWAFRRLKAGQPPFPRVVFQDRVEGFAARTASDMSTDSYSCLSFEEADSKRDNLDAVSCASVFSSDKGRYLTAQDVEDGYAEPFDGTMRALSLTSPYPPRQDVTRCLASGCFDHEDVERFAEDAQFAMPELDAVTMATLAAHEHVSLSFVLPDDLPDAPYRLLLEIHSEGDYNETYNDETYPTPETPTNQWDSWAKAYGYPYRGQPSVVFGASLDFTVDAEQRVSIASGYTNHAGDGDTLHSLDDTISNDPLSAAGSGVDRLHELSKEGERFRVRTLPRGSRDPSFGCEPLP